MFVREVSASEFITGDALASQIGLTAGTSQHSTAGWLKFADSVDGKTKYVAKKPLRHSISWDQIHATGAVFGSVTVVVNGDTYKVRLLSGANTDPATGPNSYNGPETIGSEWNRLMYRISSLPFVDNSNTLSLEDTAIGDWASYSEADLLTHNSFGNGSATWCNEAGSVTGTRLYRGFNGIVISTRSTSGLKYAVYGWRPVLELIQ